MPRFYFDTHDGDIYSPDQLGSDFKNPQLAHQGAINELYRMTNQKFVGTIRREIRIRVRDDQGKSVAEASLTVGSERLN